MGFNANPTIYRLDFENPALDGLIVRVRRGSVQIRSDYDAAETWRDQLEVFTRVLVEWNLVDDENSPLPLTVDSLLATEDQVVTAMLDGWVQAGRPSVPLEQPSTPGEIESASPLPPATTRDPEMEASMTMTPLAS
ncbi:MAG TPA: hypothetical protein VFG15_06360 [Amycolatopsis sp.]|nr:hypothetical protein [Amycolatopsis sp.]